MPFKLLGARTSFPSPALRSGLEIKVWWVLKSSWNFLSNEQKNIHILSNNDWENLQLNMSTIPKKEKKTFFVHFHTSVSFVSRKDCIEYKESPKTLGGIFYQMDQIWWAPCRLKKSTSLKMRSQLSHTFGHLMITTLYGITDSGQGQGESDY